MSNRAHASNLVRHKTNFIDFRSALDLMDFFFVLLMLRMRVNFYLFPDLCCEMNLECFMFSGLISRVLRRIYALVWNSAHKLMR